MIRLTYLYWSYLPFYHKLNLWNMKVIYCRNVFWLFSFSKLNNLGKNLFRFDMKTNYLKVVITVLIYFVLKLLPLTDNFSFYDIFCSRVASPDGSVSQSLQISYATHLVSSFSYFQYIHLVSDIYWVKCDISSLC